MKWQYLVLSALFLAVAAALTFPLWRDWLWPAEVEANAARPHEEAPVERVRLSPQARANLKLRVGKVEPVKEPYRRSVTVPGWVVERAGSCERVVAAPLQGVVKQIAAVRGDLLKPGAPLFTLQVVSEPFLSAQSNLFKAQRELAMAQAEKKRLTQPLETGAIPMARMIEIDNQIALLSLTAQTLERELAVRGLSAPEIAQAAGGKFIQEITLPVPAFAGDGHEHSSSAGHVHRERVYEMEELKVILGEMVQAGAPLCVLADHYHLQIEGKVFASEAGLIHAAAKEGTALEAEFTGEAVKGWAPFETKMTIANVANKVDPNHQTLSFFVPLANQFQEYQREGKTFRLWRFRPGQRVQLRIPAEAFTDVFVLPAEAVVREGAETFVFRVNGPYCERKSVHVVYEDRQVALVANDGSILAGLDVLALNAAVQINWALKAQAQGEGGGHHHHHHD